jgi:hypothetical protein
MQTHHTGYFHSLVFAGLLLLIAEGSFAKDAKVQIHVKPDQAYVYVDGTPFGAGSRKISVAPGKHSIGVYNYGFKPQVQEVSLNEGTNENMDFTLVAVPGSVGGPWGRLQIEGATRAAVYLNGKTPEYFVAHGDEINNSGNLFACCTQQLIVPAGTHQVTVVYPHAEKTWSGSVDIPANKRVVLNVNSGEQKVKDWPESAGINSAERFTAGTASASIAIPPVTGSISAEAAQINCGDSANVAWRTSEAVEATVSADAETLKQADLNGNLAVQPKKSTSYQLQASGPGGSIKSSATVNVNTVVQSSIEASPAEVKYRRIGDKVLVRGTSNLDWKASNANSISIDPVGTVAPTGTQTLQISPKQTANGPVDEVQTYTLTAKNDCGGSNTQTASVRVTGSIEPIPDVPLASVFFPTGYPTERYPAAGLVPSQQEALARAAEGFKKYLEYDPEARLSIVGHADSRDSTESNKSLSERRAYRVTGYLISVGIPAEQIETVAYGDSQNLDESAVASLHDQNPNKLQHKTTQGLVWAYNRRVDISLNPKGEHSAQFYPGNVPEVDFLSSNNRPGRKEIVTLAAEKAKLPIDSAPNQ